MPFGLQPIHLVVVVLVALVIFGPKRLPQLGRWIGRTFTEFRKGARDMTDGFKAEDNQTRGKSTPAAKSDSHPLAHLLRIPSRPPAISARNVGLRIRWMPVSATSAVRSFPSDARTA